MLISDSGGSGVHKGEANDRAELVAVNSNFNPKGHIMTETNDYRSECIWLKLEMRRIQDQFSRGFNELGRVCSLLGDQTKTKMVDAEVVKRYLNEFYDNLADYRSWVDDIMSAEEKNSK